MKRTFNCIKKLHKRPGIYIISCTKTDKVYIGESFNISARISKHFSNLRANKHHNLILQNIFNKYGEENLIVDVLEWINEESDNKVLDNILKRKEIEFQLKYQNCINYDKNGYAWTTNATEQQRIANKQQLDSIREKAIEACQKPIIIYNINTKEVLKVKSLKEACQYIEQKHIYRNIKDHIYLPYKGTYVAFEEGSFDTTKILYTKCTDRASISEIYILYNLIKNSEISFPSKTQFSLHFSPSRNDKLYDKYCTFIDGNFQTAIKINSIDDFWKSDFQFYKTKTSSRVCNMKVYYEALKTFKNNTDFANKVGISRKLIPAIFKQKSIEDRITEVETTAGHLTRLKLETLS